MILGSFVGVISVPDASNMESQVNHGIASIAAAGQSAFSARKTRKTRKFCAH
jgi:hypothetical protein